MFCRFYCDYCLSSFKYIDSLAFLNNGLANLANNLHLDELVKVEKWLQKKLVSAGLPVVTSGISFFCSMFTVYSFRLSSYDS